MNNTSSAQHPSAIPPMYTYSSPSSEMQTPTSPPMDSQQASPSSPLGYWGINNISRQPKQIRNPRAPLYVPAVLRPTEKPTRPSSPTNRRPDKARLDATTPVATKSTTSLQSELPSLRRMVTEEWIGATRGKIAGPPSRNHWKPDPSSDSCDSPTCERSFNILIRRHHCRRCGCIFCAEHSPHSVPLDEHARFHPLAQRYRACDDCFKDYRIWETERLRLSKDNRLDGPDSSVDSDDAAINITNKAAVKPSTADANAALLAQSVPSNWNWSTF